jgi:hypothetical protein
VRAIPSAAFLLDCKLSNVLEFVENALHAAATHTHFFRKLRLAWERAAITIGVVCNRQQ